MQLLEALALCGGRLHHLQHSQDSVTVLFSDRKTHEACVSSADELGACVGQGQAGTFAPAGGVAALPGVPFLPAAAQAQCHTDPFK